MILAESNIKYNLVIPQLIVVSNVFLLSLHIPFFSVKIFDVSLFSISIILAFLSGIFLFISGYNKLVVPLGRWFWLLFVYNFLLVLKFYFYSDRPTGFYGEEQIALLFCYFGLFILFRYFFILKWLNLFIIARIATVMSLLGSIQFWWRHFFSNDSYETIGFFVYIPLLAFFLVLSLFLLLQYPISNQRIQYLIIIILIITLVFCASRTALLGALLGGGIYLLIKYRLSPKGIALVSLIFIATSLLFYYVNESSVGGRVILWKVGIQSLKLNTIVLGNGFSYIYNQLGELQKEYLMNASMQEKLLAGEVRTIFNEYLKIILETGIIGFLLFSVVFVRLVTQLYQSGKIWVMAGIISVLFFALFSYPFYSIPLCVLLVAVAADTPSIGQTLNFALYRKVLIVASGFIITALFYYQGTRLTVLYRWLKAKQINPQYNEVRFRKEYKDLYFYLNNNPEFLMDYANKLRLISYLRESSVLYDRALMIQPTQERYSLLGDVQQRLKNYDLAELCYRNAIQTLPQKFIPRYILFQFYKQLGLSVKAKAIATEIALFPIKIPSKEISNIKEEAINYLKKHSYEKM